MRLGEIKRVSLHQWAGLLYFIELSRYTFIGQKGWSAPERHHGALHPCWYEERLRLECLH